MNRTALVCLSAVIAGAVLLHRYPFPSTDPLLILVRVHSPALFHLLRCAWTAMMFTTPAVGFSIGFSLAYIFAGKAERKSAGHLPPFPICSDSVQVVLGEVHNERNSEPSEAPRWEILPQRGLFTGMAIFGAIGTGKTSCCMRPYAEQILGYRASSREERIGGIVLEVKGDFCHQVRQILQDAGRGDDYMEISLESEYVYNPLHNDLDAFALAYSIASLLNNLYGKGKEPFWQQAYTNLVKFIILLHKVVDGYVTLLDVYICAINPNKLSAKIKEGDAMFEAVADAPAGWISIDPMLYLAHGDELGADRKWETVEDKMRTVYDEPVERMLVGWSAPYTIEIPEGAEDAGRLMHRLEEFAAVKRWFADDWMRMDAKLRTSIVEGISVFLSLFDDNPKLKSIFCPPKEAYDPQVNKNGRFGTPLPTFTDLIESGKVVALNFPVAANPATARAVGCMLKQDYQRAMLGRIPAMAQNTGRHFRESMFLCDEYQSFATVGESDPSGDEKFFALARQAKCIAIVATQSISSLRSTLDRDSCNTLLQTFRTKLFLATADDATAKTASELCGREERMVPSTSISESGHDAGVSILTGKAQAHKAGLTMTKNYAQQMRPTFEPKEFMEMQNAQCVALVYDGVNPLPAHRLFLKPYYNDVQLSYFQQRDKGML
jgi:hypothetical protein